MEKAALSRGLFLFPSLNIRAVSMGGREYVGRGVPAGEVPCGSTRLTVGGGDVQDWTLQGGFERML